MKVPDTLASAFGSEFEELIAQFSIEQELLPDLASLKSQRYLARSIVPHVTKLSALFNRDAIRALAKARNLPKEDLPTGLSPYWKESSNPQHLRLAYFLYFMPSNLFRVAAI